MTSAAADFQTNPRGGGENNNLTTAHPPGGHVSGSVGLYAEIGAASPKRSTRFDYHEHQI